MSLIWMLIGIGAITLFLILIFALCRSAGQADRMAGYEEEYAKDFMDDEDGYR